VRLDGTRQVSVVFAAHLQAVPTYRVLLTPTFDPRLTLTFRHPFAFLWRVRFLKTLVSQRPITFETIWMTLPSC
jgi:hypothetical protein